MTRYTCKTEILSKVHLLKGSSIYIKRDLTESERGSYNKLREHMKLARSKHLNAFIRRDKLYISGDAYTAENLPEILREEEEYQPPKRLTLSAPSTPASDSHVADCQESIPSDTLRGNYVDDRHSQDIREQSTIAGIQEKAHSEGTAGAKELLVAASSAGQCRIGRELRSLAKQRPNIRTNTPPQSAASAKKK